MSMLYALSINVAIECTVRRGCVNFDAQFDKRRDSTIEWASSLHLHSTKKLESIGVLWLEAPYAHASSSTAQNTSVSHEV